MLVGKYSFFRKYLQGTSFVALNIQDIVYIKIKDMLKLPAFLKNESMPSRTNTFIRLSVNFPN